MRGLPFRLQPWIAAAILGIALVGACSLNPQPLPPEGNANTGSSGGGTSPMGGLNSSSSGGSSSGPGGGGFASSSGAAPPPPVVGSSSGASSSGSSSGGNIPSGDAGVGITSDGGSENSDATAAIDAAADGGVPSDSGADGSSPDGGPEDASPGNNECMRALDCYVSRPGACAVCPWPLNHAVCVEHQCGCACDGRDAAGD